MTYEALIKLTKAKLEEFSPFNDNALIATSGLSGYEDKPVEAYIDNYMDEACNWILSVVPLRLIEPTSITIIKQTNHRDGTGELEIGDDYLRLYTFKMQSWDRAVKVAIDETNPLFILQDNKYTMGNMHKPVVTYQREEGIHILKYFSCPKSDRDRTIEKAFQVSRFNRNNIQDSLAEFYATKCAELVYKTYGMADNATIMQAEIEKMIATR
jgi:hypothetical protein